MMEPSVYLDRYAVESLGIANQISVCPQLVIVIPAFKEPDLLSTLDSLQASFNESGLASTGLLVLIIFNAPEGHEEALLFNGKSAKEVENWKSNLQNTLPLHIANVVLPKKKAGVGLARKTGMDEAVRIFRKFDHNGIIVNLDADCRVASNYVKSIINHFMEYQKSPGASIHFEHALDSTPITLYELHLRYFINAQRYCGLPFAFQTIGSSMAVRVRAYEKQGGMNVRKAGEDFYFIQKIILLGNYTEINDTTVIPSGRISDRVPFGTGRAMQDWHKEEHSRNLTYHFKSFVILKEFIDQIQNLFVQELSIVKQNIDPKLWNFLVSIDFESALVKLKKNASNQVVFRKQFFTWFDGFQLMKYLHFMRDHHYPDIPIDEAVEWLFDNFMFDKKPDELDTTLNAMREFDKSKVVAI